MPSSGLHKFKFKNINMNLNLRRPDDGIYAETCSLNENKLIRPILSTK
jgi:hypothetical protein